MALIRCPECRREVSTSAEACPHCGFPVRHSSKAKKKIVPKPLDRSWMDYWKKAPTRKRLLLTFIFLASLAVSGIFLYLTVTAHDDAFLTLLILDYVFAVVLMLNFAMWIAGFICLKEKTLKCDGYHVIAIAGIWHNYLVIENKVFEKTHNRHLDGKLPNGKRVTADFSFWDSSITIAVDR